MIRKHEPMAIGHADVESYALVGLLCACLSLTPVTVMAQGQDLPLSELSIEDLMKVQVVTASRTQEPLTRSASVMTVIAARDIERSGYRTIYDVLARVPGFFPTSQATWKLVGTRGLVSDGNDHILLLVDGHPQNSIVAHGSQQQDQIPALEKVERIEIIRGPGSVLWGGSAANAIINVVTKDDLLDGKTLRSSSGYGSGDGLVTFNIMKDVPMGDAKGVISASYWKADGYNTPNGPNVKFPWGSFTNAWPALDAQNPGFELYLKLKSADGQQILARIVQTSVPYPWDSWSYDKAGGMRPGSELRMRKAYLDYQTTQVYSDRFKVQYTAYGDMLLQNRFPLQVGQTDPTLDTRFIEDQSREELAAAAEGTATYQFTAAHALTFGSKYVHTIAGPNRGFRFDTETNLPTAPAPGEEQVPVIDIPSGKDNDVAVYAEDRLSFNDRKTDVFAGVRADHNDWRENRTVFLPRAGIIHSLTPSLTAKYVMNTGYLRPNAAYSKSGGKFYRAPSKTIESVNVVDKSEQVRSHDVQLTFTDKRNYLIGTLFYMTVDNFISWETKLDLGYRDMGAAYSYGGEMEARYCLGPDVALNANYSLAKGYLRSIPTGVDVNGVTQLLDGALTNADREWLNYPMHMWNVGADVALHDNHSVNVNVRGWEKMQIVEPFTAPNPGAYGELSGVLYVDASYLARDVFANVSLRLSAMNVFNNTDPTGMVVNNGVFNPRGRSLSVQLSKGF